MKDNRKHGISPVCPYCQSGSWKVVENHGHPDDRHLITAECRDCKQDFDIVYLAALVIKK